MEHTLRSTNIADILERVLDKGLVIAGDITISIAEIDLLKIKIRLLIASVDKAREIGINWWENDPYLSSGAQKQLAAETRNTREKLPEKGREEPCCQPAGGAGVKRTVTLKTPKPPAN